MKIPHGAMWSDLIPTIPVFFAYILSFIYLGAYWNNHHHLFQSVSTISGKVLWANLNLLFWLSLIPFATGWMGETNFTKAPVALYGMILFCAAVSYFILQKVIILTEGDESPLKKAIGKDFKGMASTIIYIFAIILSFFKPWVAGSL